MTHNGWWVFYNPRRIISSRSNELSCSMDFADYASTSMQPAILQGLVAFPSPMLTFRQAIVVLQSDPDMHELAGLANWVSLGLLRGLFLLLVAKITIKPDVHPRWKNKINLLLWCFELAWHQPAAHWYPSRWYLIIDQVWSDGKWNTMSSWYVVMLTTYFLFVGHFVRMELEI